MMCYRTSRVNTVILLWDLNKTLSGVLLYHRGHGTKGLPQCMAQLGGLLRLQTYLLQGSFLFWVPLKTSRFLHHSVGDSEKYFLGQKKKKKKCPKPKEAYRALCFYLSESESVIHSVVSNSLRPHGLQSPKFLCPWNSVGKNTGVSCHSLHQGIFRSQGSNPGLLHGRQILYHLSHPGSLILR